MINQQHTHSIPFQDFFIPFKSFHNTKIIYMPKLHIYVFEKNKGKNLTTAISSLFFPQLGPIKKEVESQLKPFHFLIPFHLNLHDCVMS